MKRQLIIADDALGLGAGIAIDPGYCYYCKIWSGTLVKEFPVIQGSSVVTGPTAACPLNVF